MKKTLMGVILCLFLLLVGGLFVLSKPINVNASGISCNYVAINGNVGETLYVEFFDGKSVTTEWKLDSDYAKAMSGGNLLLEKSGVGTLTFKIGSQSVDVPFSIKANSTGQSAKTPSLPSEDTASPKTTPKTTAKATGTSKATETPKATQEVTSKPVTSQKPDYNEKEVASSDSSVTPEQARQELIYIETSDTDSPNISMSIGEDIPIDCINGQIDLSTKPDVIESEGMYSLYVVKSRDDKVYYFRVGEFEIQKGKAYITTSHVPSSEVKAQLDENTFTINAKNDELI